MHFGHGQVAVGDLGEDVADDVEAGGAFVVAVGHKPGRPGGVGGGEHVVAGLGVVVPAAVGFDVHRREFPHFARVGDAVFQAAFLFFHVDFQPVFQQDDAAVDQGFFKKGHDGEEFAGVLFGAEAHHAFHAGAVVPAAVENHHFAGGGQVGDVALQVDLAFFALGGGGQGDGAEHARADALGEGFDGAAFARAVAPLEDDAHFQPLLLHPALQGDEFAVQGFEFFQVFFQADFVLGFGFFHHAAAPEAV